MCNEGEQSICEVNGWASCSSEVHLATKVIGRAYGVVAEFQCVREMSGEWLDAEQCFI